jgi:uncharacterized protein
MPPMSDASTSPSNGSARVLGADLLTSPLPHEPLPVDDVIAGAPTAGTHPLAELGDLEIGLWEMSAGAARDTETDEIFLVLSGRGEVRFADGETIALRPGVAVRLRAGERTAWTISEPLRKVYLAR